jgi:hypothetical protein
VLRKQVYELTAEDLLRFPAWQFALDEEAEAGQDEATVRPYPFEGALDPAAGMFIVSASFRLSDGSQMKGYLTPPGPNEDGLRTIQPIIVTTLGQVMFWRGMFMPTPEELDADYRRLGKSSSSQVFPIHFASDVPLLKGPIQGELIGFLFVEDITATVVRVVT